MVESITKNTSLSIGIILALLIPLLISASAWGSLNQKVENIEKDIDRIEESTVSLNEKFEEILRTKLFSLEQF